MMCARDGGDQTATGHGLFTKITKHVWLFVVFVAFVGFVG